MEHYKNAGKVDPDYESYNSALEINEEEDKKENLAKLKKIIEEEYSKEIFQRQDQIEQIELQICKVRKLLHLLRYVVVMSYYKKQELEYNGSEEEAGISDSLIMPDKQNRIHPAVKKLLGRNVQTLEHLRVKEKRKTISRSSNDKPDLDLQESKRIKLEAPENKEQFAKPVVKQEFIEYSRDRKKTKYRIIVGNISKWMPSSEDDALTHKWMVYVRGPKDAPDVSHFVDKTVFYLHPSYKPYDVVEVSESPFHLSRRGWGEFPVRVQIFFKISINKPIDVIHNLKLDKTYSGRQTLGNETIVDVFLYDSNHKSQAKEDFIDNVVEEEEFSMKKEIDVEAKTDLSEATSTIEHDYCSDTFGKKNFDHCYSLPPSLEGVAKPKKEKIEQDLDNKLIYGLESYLSTPEKKKFFTADIKKLIQINPDDIRLSNSKILVLSKKGTSVAKVVTVVKASEFKVVLPKDRFKNMGEALPYLFKKLPLCSDLANNLNYKRMYPFTATTLKEFESWNVGKRRSAEWSRARTIKKLLLSARIYGADQWNTKAILMYGRSHDYTPYTSYGLFVRESEEKNLIMCCYFDSNPIKNNVDKVENEPDVTVNVDSETDLNSPKKLPLLDITDVNNHLECSYIRHSALDCGIILKHEEIIDGVKVNGAELMILEAVKCLASNLIRRARNHRVCVKTPSSNANSISVEDVEAAINERPELLCLRQFKRNQFS